MRNKGNKIVLIQTLLFGNFLIVKLPRWQTFSVVIMILFKRANFFRHLERSTRVWLFDVIITKNSRLYIREYLAVP